MWKPDLLNRDEKGVSPWSAFGFATFLCLMMLGGSLLPFASWNPATPAFYAFLPVVFLMIAYWQRRHDRVVSDLRKRIESLEAIVTARKAGAV